MRWSPGTTPCLRIGALTTGADSTTAARRENACALNLQVNIIE
jgi:hypothetical protein